MSDGLLCFQYTVANFIDLERLGLEVDLTLTMKPDGASGGVVVVDNTPIIESITLRSSVSTHAPAITT